MTPQNYSEAKEFFAKMDAKLSAYDFKGSASLFHTDGSIMHFSYAFVIREGDWICCFTEHHGFHVYHFEDLDGYDEWNSPLDNPDFRTSSPPRSDKAKTSWRNPEP